MSTSVSVSRNNREKYSEIKLIWWDTVLGNRSNNLGTRVQWWLEDHISFRVGDSPVEIPIGGETGEGKYRTYFHSMSVDRIQNILRDSWYVKYFPRNGSFTTRSSTMHIFGEDDNMIVEDDEFFAAGGELQLLWDNETFETKIVITPPITRVGVNENFSVTLEGSVPALYINDDGFMLERRETSFYTEFYGKTNNVLEVDLPHVVGRENAFRVAQKLLEKYSYGNTQFNLEYYGAEVPTVDSKELVPQTVTIDSNGKRATSNAFIYKSLDSLPNKPLQELGSDEHTLRDVQFYPLAFLT